LVIFSERAEGEVLVVAAYALQAVLAYVEEGERQADDRVGELVQGLEAQAVAQQRVEDLGKAVVPLERDGVLRLGLGSA
jgi:hypothetical protein